MGSAASNYFLNCLTADDQRLLAPHLRLVQIEGGQVLHSLGEQIGDVYMPLSGILSLTLPFHDGRMGELGIAGANTVVGAIAVLRDTEAIHSLTAEVGGRTYKIATRDLRKCVEQSRTLLDALRKHEQAQSAQTFQIAACNAVHTLQERLCRWLLQCRDLLATTDLPVTQDILSAMLGVRRPSLTLVAGELQRAGLIKSRRGYFEIIDNDGLKDASCECYEAILGQLQRLTGWSPGLNNRDCGE